MKYAIRRTFKLIIITGLYITVTSLYMCMALFLMTSCSQDVQEAVPSPSPSTPLSTTSNSFTNSSSTSAPNSDSGSVSSSGSDSDLNSTLDSDSNLANYSDSSSLNQQSQPKNSLMVNGKMLQCRYYNELDFHQSVDNAESFGNAESINNTKSSYNAESSGSAESPDNVKASIEPTDIGVENSNIDSIKIKGGIVPHHLLAGEMIASFFKTISVEQPEVIVMIAPNHKGTGVKAVHTGSWSWQTPFGVLDADEEIIKSLIDSNIADTNFDLLEEEHSIAGLVPYIKYYMPDSKIVPILLHGTYRLKDAQQLGQNLQNKLINENKKGLIIASVDFSHYLTLEKADEMDEVSIKAIKNRDISLIQNFNNDYIDSPPSIITLLSAMDTVGAAHMEILDHSNSDRITGAKSNETTSYFTVIFYDK